MGKVVVTGAVNMTAPVSGIKASDLAVGTVVKLMEDGVATDFLVVNQGNPDESLYDASCGGVWLLRKEIKKSSQWDTILINSYSNSSTNTYLNSDYFNSLGTIEQFTIKQVKIPYVNGTGSGGSVASGANGLSVKIMLLSGYEVGFTTTNTGEYLPIDGAKLSYFELGTTTTANNKRIKTLNGASSGWWLRSPYTNNSASVWLVHGTGTSSRVDTTETTGIAPALIIPSTARFDPTTLLLKG